LTRNQNEEEEHARLKNRLGQDGLGLLKVDEGVIARGDPLANVSAPSRIHPLSRVKIEMPVIPRHCYCVGLLKNIEAT